MPSKSKASLVEEALGIRFDWSNGRAGAEELSSAIVDSRDVDLMLLIARLPKATKDAIAEIARQQIALMDTVSLGRLSVVASAAPA